jgi:hypothetical protein
VTAKVYERNAINDDDRWSRVIGLLYLTTATVWVGNRVMIDVRRVDPSYVCARGIQLGDNQAIQHKRKDASQVVVGRDMGRGKETTWLCTSPSPREEASLGPNSIQIMSMDSHGNSGLACVDRITLPVNTDEMMR